MRFRSQVVLLLLAILLASITPASAGLIYSNGVPDRGQAFNITDFRTADDFVLGQAASVVAIRFWAMADTNHPADFGGTVSWAMYNNSAGALGTLAASGSTSGVAAVPTGYLWSSSSPEYLLEFNLTSAVSLAAGTYWLELHEGPTLTLSDGTSIYWETSSWPNFSGNSRQSGIPTLPGAIQPAEMAFQLFDTPFSSVPEPGTMLLLGAGLVGLSLLKRRKK